MNLLVITRLLSGLLMVGLPVALGIFLTRRFRLGWRLWGIGAATFVLSQVGHLPFNWLLNRLFVIGVLPPPPAAWRLIFFAMLGGLSAGLWEELARAGVYRWWADDARSWRKGMLLGAGHGGIEAIIFGALVLNGFVNMMILRGPDAAKLVPPEQLPLVQQQLADYWSVTPLLPFLAPLERVFAITNHLACSLLVLQAFTRRQPAWIAVAVIYHALLDGIMAYYAALWSAQPWGMLATEGVIGIGALASLILIFILYRVGPVVESEPGEVESPPAVEPVQPARISEILQQQPEADITEEAVDQSRFSS